MTFNNIKYILLLLFTALTVSASAQKDTTLTQEVEVVKAYKPGISDANKINEMPRKEKVEHQKPTFNYSIFSQPVFSTFSVNPLKAATTEGQTETDKGYGMIKAGFGNYSKPYGELFFNSNNLRNTLFGFHGKHLSSHGKITLEGDDKADAPFSENEAELFIKHLFSRSILSVNLNYDHDGFNYYGYPLKKIPAVLTEEGQDINYLGSKQAFSKGGLDIRLNNPVAGKNDTQYDFDFHYHYFSTQTEQKEHFGELSANIKKPLESGTGIIKAGVSYTHTDSIFNNDMQMMGKRAQTWLYLHPAWHIEGKNAGIQFGFKSWFIMDNDKDASAHLAPNIKANFEPVKDIINLFAGLDGNYINNHYSKIAYENPFVNPLHDVKNTFEKFHFYGGFDGKFASKTNFKIAADYSVITDQPFYYLFEYVAVVPPGTGTGPNPVVTDNDFNVLYDDMNRLKLNFEVYNNSMKRFNMLLSGNYYAYKTNTQEEAWNLPSWDANLTVEYKVNEQLSIATDLYFIGERQALIVGLNEPDPRPVDYNTLITDYTDPDFQHYKLKTAFDLNLRANYKITSNFSAFAHLNNFGFQKYQQWFGYPVQSFNFLAGLSYTF